MLLTIDIGNTNISLGIFDGDKKVFTSRLATQRERTKDQYAAELLIIFRLNNINAKDIDGSIISSVVPELTDTVLGAVKKVTGIESLILEPGTKTGLKIVNNCHSQVGADLVAASVAAIAKYPLPCLIVDLGTATKIILVDETATFRGCTISAGVKISLDALSQKTSQLPAISLKTPETAIGTNTTDCMLAGTVLGTAAMLDGLCERMEKEFGQKIKSTIATGGYSQEIIKSCYRKMIYDEDLLLDGLKVIFDKNQH